MNQMNRVVRTFLTGTAILLMLNGCSRHGPTLTIRTFIDGSDIIKVSGNNVWFEHEEFDLPGKNGGGNYPTYINGQPWMPDWTDKTSAPYEGVKPAFKPRDVNKVKLVKRMGRGTATIVQAPATESGTLAIRIDDNAESGAALYEIIVSW